MATKNVVVIIHSQALTVREPHVMALSKAFQDCEGVVVVIAAGPEPPSDDPAKLAEMVCMQPSKLGPPDVHAVFAPRLGDLKMRNLSNSLKHACALKHIAEAYPEDREGATWNVVLEDDSLVTNAANVMQACSQAPADADVIFFGIPPAPHLVPEAGTLRFHALIKNSVLPTCDSYAVRTRTARYATSSFMPIRFPTHIHLSWLIASSDMTAYVTSPNLSLDGSKLGVYVSMIESNNALPFDEGYVRLSQTKDPDQAQALVGGMRFNGHPDVLSLLGRILADAGRHGDAKRVMDEAYEKYCSENTVIGMDSAFMRAYLRLHKHLQVDRLAASVQQQ